MSEVVTGTVFGWTACELQRDGFCACAAELACVGHLRLPSATLQTTGQPAVLETEALAASGLCTVTYRGQHLLAAGIAAARVGTPIGHKTWPAMQSGYDSSALPRETNGTLPGSNTARFEPVAGGCWEGSCCFDALQLDSALQLGALDMHKADAVALSQAAAISMNASHSNSPSDSITVTARSASAAAETSLSCAVGSSFTCRGVESWPITVASKQQYTLPSTFPLTNAAGPFSRRNTNLAAQASIRSLPRAARLLRVEALVRCLNLLLTPSWTPSHPDLTQCRWLLLSMSRLWHTFHRML